MDRPDAVGHFGRWCRVSPPAQGRHAGIEGRGAPRSGAGGATRRSIRGHRAGHFVGGAAEAAYLGRQGAVRALAVCDRPQQADRFAAPPRPAGFRQHRRFRRDDPERTSRGDGSCERGRGPVAVAAGAAARRTAIDRGRQRVDQGYGCEIRDERGRGARGAAPRACQPHRQTAGAMRMETDQLIRTLAGDNAHRARPVGFVLALALLAAAPVSVAMFFAGLGVRPDVMTAMHNPFFDLKFLVTLAVTLYASHCTDDSPLFVATWYTIATVLVTAIGALAGSRVLRF